MADRPHLGDEVENRFLALHCGFHVHLCVFDGGEAVVAALADDQLFLAVLESVVDEFKHGASISIICRYQ